MTALLPGTTCSSPEGSMCADAVRVVRSGSSQRPHLLPAARGVPGGPARPEGADRLRYPWAHSHPGASPPAARTGRPYDVGATRSSRAPIRPWWRAVRTATTPPRTPENGAGEGERHLDRRGETPSPNSQRKPATNTRQRPQRRSPSVSTAVRSYSEARRGPVASLHNSRSASWRSPAHAWRAIRSAGPVT